MSDNKKGVGPPIDDLKAKFLAQAIPLAEDFASLINIADIGRKAAGLAPDQNETTGAGLERKDTGQLAVRLGDGIQVDDSSRVCVKLKNGSGLAVDKDGLSQEPVPLFEQLDMKQRRAIFRSLYESRFSLFQWTKLPESNLVKANQDQFGNSVSLSADGQTLAVGANGDDNDMGSVYVFTRSKDAWTDSQKLPTSEHSLVRRNFGYSVSLSADGQALAVGANSDDNDMGSVYVFTRSKNTWALQKKVTANVRAEKDAFGLSVNLSADGQTLAVGAPGVGDTKNLTASGAVYVFSRSGDAWTEQQEVTAGGEAVSGDGFGTHISLSADGQTLAVGVSRKSSKSGGSVYVFSRSGDAWIEQQPKPMALDGAVGDSFGDYVSLSADGQTLAVAAGGSNFKKGAVYVFIRSGNAWTQRKKLVASDGEEGDHFGDYVSLSANGQILAIGAPYDDDKKGSVYVFSPSGDAWTEQQPKLMASDGASKDYFGHSVSLSADGQVLAVGAFGFDTTKKSGWAYLFH